MSCEDDLTSSKGPDLAELGFKLVLSTSSIASFNRSCLIGLKIVTYLHQLMALETLHINFADLEGLLASRSLVI